jgi:hypothetical protein
MFHKLEAPLIIGSMTQLTVVEVVGTTCSPFLDSVVAYHRRQPQEAVEERICRRYREEVEL